MYAFAIDLLYTSYKQDITPICLHAFFLSLSRKWVLDVGLTVAESATIGEFSLTLVCLAIC